ncbi:MAG: UDP-3-O-(3-hydroxymyristoyl)glucosamine N-acyltransferase [Micavibrio aeruginosavorus]|uniref:UDP-3-O-acylglucosamine N-acyltransferase n=1 Tax=Micavibrio aeruginosavorus TaxID=349221 RepID=A0A7T5UFZ5_9BACT|nr:MAG: UDP-3-O-(3-hydroxymyristoyl)glucosamine N-acyltransferase [Micavibrio aeruginosavorus]
MPDSRFFKRAAAKSVADLAQIAGAALGSGSDSGRMIEDVAPLDKAGPEHVSFLDNPKYRDAFAATKAGACIVSEEMASLAPEGMATIVTKSPYKTYALVAQAFYPDTFPEAYIAAGAHIHPLASIASGCVISEGVVIGAGVEVGEGSWIEPNAVIGANVKIGRDCRIGANTVISHTLMGDHVRVYPGACIGQDGFGFAIDPRGHVKVPQLGRVIIEDSVEIGAGCTIDRGSGPDTVIGQGTWMDNLVQIGHNVKIGRGCVIVSQCGISGSTVLEDFVVLGGQTGIAGHLRIGKGARIAAKSGVLRDVAPGEEQMGYPSMPIKQFFRHIAYLNRATKKG